MAETIYKYGITTLIVILVVAVALSLFGESNNRESVVDIDMKMDIPGSDLRISETESDEYAFEVYAPDYSSVAVYYGDDVGPVKRTEPTKEGFASFTLPSSTWWVTVTSLSTKDTPIKIETDGISEATVEETEAGIVVSIIDTEPSLSESMKAKVVFADYHKNYPISYTVKLGGFFSSDFGENEEREFLFRIPSKDREIESITVSRV